MYSYVQCIGERWYSLSVLWLQGSSFLSPLESAQIFSPAATFRLAGSLTIKELDTFMSCDVLADKVDGVITSSSTGPQQAYFVNITLLAGAVHKFKSKLTDKLQREYEINKSRYVTGFWSFTLQVKCLTANRTPFTTAADRSSTVR
jgi:hypothetical protein